MPIVTPPIPRAARLRRRGTRLLAAVFLSVAAPGVGNAACPASVTDLGRSGAHWHADLRCADAEFESVYGRWAGTARPSSTGVLEARALAAEQADLERAIAALEAEVATRAEERARGTRSDPDPEADDRALAEELERLRVRLATVVDAIAALPAEDPLPDPVGAAELHELAGLYARLADGISDAPGPVTPGELCAVWARGAVAAEMAGQSGAASRMVHAAAAYADACVGTVEPLLGNGKVSLLWSEGTRVAYAGRGAFVETDVDEAAWYLDGTEISPREGGFTLRAGLHRVDRAGRDGPSSHVTFEIADGERAWVEWTGTRLRVRGLPPSGSRWRDGEAAAETAPAVTLGPVRPVVGAAWVHDDPLGLAGATVSFAWSRAPRWRIDLRGAVGLTPTPVYLTRWESTHVLPRADLSVQFLLAPSLSWSPRLSLGGFGEPGITAGLRAGASFDLPVPGGRIELGLGLPWGLVGPAAGPGVELTITPALDLGSRGGPSPEEGG